MRLTKDEEGIELWDKKGVGFLSWVNLVSVLRENASEGGPGSQRMRVL